MSEPTRVSAAQMRAAYNALGLHPERWNDTMRIDITPHAVIVTRASRNEDGRMHVDHIGSLAVDATCIEVDWSGP